MQMKNIIKNFFMPKFGGKFMLRLAIVAVLAFILFRYFLIPMKIHGESMEPKYKTGSFNFCRTFPKGGYRRGEVVIIRLAGTRVMYMKRIVALEDEVVEFKGGILHVNSIPQEEPYVKGPCNWELEARTVEKGSILKLFGRLSDYVSHSPGESPIKIAVKMNAIQDIFDSECELEAGQEWFSGTYSPQEIASNVSRTKMTFKSIALSFKDISVELRDENSADSFCTVLFSAVKKDGKIIEDVRELKVSLKKKDKRWVFSRFEIIETLKK